MSSAQICAIHLLFSLFVNKDNPCKNDSEERHRLWLANDPGSLYNPGFTSLKIENKYFSHVWGIIDPIWGKMSANYWKRIIYSPISCPTLNIEIFGPPQKYETVNGTLKQNFLL